MKTAQRLLKAIISSTVLMLLVSCVSPPSPQPYIPNNNMSVKQARLMLVTKLESGAMDVSGRCVNIYDSESWEEILGVRVTTTRLVVATKSGSERIFQLKSLQNMTFLSNRILFDGIHTFATYGDPHVVADALYVLQQNAIKVEGDIAEYDAVFAASLADYRKKAASNTALPEAANKYKVQAEGAVRGKEFDEAADLYAEALKIAPWWPVGHFNRALVLGENGDYGEAMREMNYYLQLAPDAPNARAAQDKIYDWERLESKQGNK